MNKIVRILILAFLPVFCMETSAQSFLKVFSDVAKAVTEAQLSKRGNSYTRQKTIGSRKSTTSFSSKSQDVTLVVTGSGESKEEAVRNALRSALEQTYGTFVSANTSIVNDELVKDEVSTVSNNCVKKYNELSDNILSNGRHFVTVQATVSISGLVSYAKSHGSSVEFSGSTFGMNMKLRELNRKNEVKAISNMLSQLISLGNLFDYELLVSDPQETTRYPDCYVMEAQVNLLFNDNTRAYNQIAYQVLYDLALSVDEVEEYGQTNTAFYVNRLPAPDNSPECMFVLRNDYSALLKDIRSGLNNVPAPFGKVYWSDSRDGINDALKYFLERSAFCFKITDNMNDPTNVLIGHAFFGNRGETTLWDGRIEDLFWIYSLRHSENTFPFASSRQKPVISKIKNGRRVGYVSFNMYIPKADISKYSNFEVKPCGDIGLYKYFSK